MRIDIAKQQVSSVMLALGDELGDDERLKLDTLEGETNLYEIVRSMLNGIEEDEGIQAALAEQIADRAARKKAAGHRVEARREAIQALMDCAQLDKLTLPEATLSIRKVPAKRIVTDADKIPPEFMQLIAKPDLAKIKASDRAIEGTAMDNGGVSITIRRK